jgi:hypothetical protein
MVILQARIEGAVAYRDGNMLLIFAANRLLMQNCGHETINAFFYYLYFCLFLSILIGIILEKFVNILGLYFEMFLIGSYEYLQ